MVGAAGGDGGIFPFPFPFPFPVPAPKLATGSRGSRPAGFVRDPVLAAWNEARVRDRLHAALLTKLRSAKQLDWSRAVIDSSHVRAVRRGPESVPARSTEHGRAASTTPPSTAKASRSRCR